MGTYKLLLDDEVGYNFSLLAIHSSVEAYHLAFLLNKHLGFRFIRTKDLTVQTQEIAVNYTLFEFCDEPRYITYHLACNKSKLQTLNPGTHLFSEEASMVDYRLLPERKQVDYILRIREDGHAFAKAKLSTEITQIPQIATAYPLDLETLKNKENLIFE